MRTSLNSIKAIDDYLLGIMEPSEAALFEANMIVNSDLTDDMQHQQSAYAVIRQYSRQKIKDEIAAVRQILTIAPRHLGFMQRIANVFKKH